MDILKPIIDDYLAKEKIEQHRDAIQALVDKGNDVELKRLFGQRLQFGTAGIRGRMGPGYNQMNDLVVIQTAQGLASYLLELDTKLVREKGVIIGNDARHNSQRFARLVALAFLQKGIKVYFNDYFVPTPFIAFGVKQYQCRAGIMVTASHNPKDDNGIKVYWHNGAQILSPHDRCIQEHILHSANQQPWPRAWDDNLLLRNSLATESQQSSGFNKSSPVSPSIIPSTSDVSGMSLQAVPNSDLTSNSTGLLPKEWGPLLYRVYGDLSRRYFSFIESLIPSDEQRERNKTATMTITFTPMHGVGFIFMERALKIGGFEDVFPVENQRRPNPEFTTVRYPNPEEAGALDEAFKTAKRTRSNLILANDPDSDRCAAALYDPTTSYKRVFNGNELGVLLGWWLWHLHTSQTPKPSSSKCYMISTAVSSKFLQTMAKSEGFNFIETLTGFKYMGNVADKLLNDQQDGQKQVIFAYEEAIGYMCDSRIIDKDGISAMLHLAQCAAYCYTAFHRNLEDQLNELYRKYGYHYSLNSYYLCHDSDTIRKIFTQLQANYPKSFDGNYKVKRIRDLNNDYDSGTKDHKPTLPSTSSSYMITFFIDSDITLTIRTSGTEPKIKYYSEIISKLSKDVARHNEEKEIARVRLAKLVQSVINDCLKPELYNLEPASC